ncbi:phosphatase PAP2 family protein [Chroococcidiopsis sp. TS-821]|uniref:phosphatase PAP2 family protein n=1 Tax=Chroococcidiopsis sp. TS-821 TaxID=1378066 RepID=UPI000CEED19C|nr:phosphatase PAP2 family protein [Chroococcidiopsis sp. TS-821]PPS39202.1 phosphatidic acid phosphatase [Chroococcidiopsis sp. TS-821]
MRSKLAKLSLRVFRIRVIGILVSVLSLWIFARLARRVLQQQTNAFDTAIMLAMRGIHNPLFDQAMMGTTFLGDPTILFIICLVLGVWLYRHQRRSAANTLAIAYLGALLLQFVLKPVFTRERPALWEQFILLRDYSFPSGHALMSLVVYGLISYILTGYFPQRQKLITSITVLLVFAIGFSRIYLGVHWPTDVIGGYAAGAVWLVACILSLRVWQQRRHRHAQVERESVSSRR